MNHGTFSAKYIKTIVQVATQQNASESEILDFLGVESLDSIANGKRFCAIQTLKLIHFIIALTGNRFFGIDLGRSFKPGTFDILGYAIMCSTSLKEAIKLNYKYQKLNQDLGVTPLRNQNDIAILEWVPEFEDQQLLRPINEAVIAGYVNLGRWLTWQTATPILTIKFAHSMEEGYRSYYDFFDCPIEFDADCTAIYFDEKFLNKPLQQADPVMTNLMIGQLDQRLVELNSDRCILTEVSCFIQSKIGQPLPTAERTASTLGYHERTLRRKLKEYGTSYSKLLDDVRRDTAISYLKSTNISLSELALILGYQDQSAFCRAFRTWFNISPGRFRANNTKAKLKSA